MVGASEGDRTARGKIGSSGGGVSRPAERSVASVGIDGGGGNVTGGRAIVEIATDSFGSSSIVGEARNRRIGDVESGGARSVVVGDGVENGGLAERYRVASRKIW